MNTPKSVKQSTILWVVAVLAGISETILAVSGQALDGSLDASMWMNIALRVVIYTFAFVLIVNFSRGRAWARIILTALLSLIGVAAMVVPAALAMFAGDTFMDAFGSDDNLGIFFVSVRMVHIAAVLAATMLMYTPSANKYFSSK